MKNLTIALSLCLSLITGTAIAEGDAEAGATKAAVCAGCHGMDGKALQPTYANIGGQHASYIAKQLTNYRDGERNNELMNGIAASLTDEDIVDLAAYYASQPLIEGVASEDNLEHGESIYRGGITAIGVPSCMGCHGAAGKGNLAAVYPVLAGQGAEYTALQLQHFRSGERNNDPNAMMRSLSKRLSDEEIQAVSNYIQGLN